MHSQPLRPTPAEHSEESLQPVLTQLLEDIETRPFGDPEIQRKLRLVTNCQALIQGHKEFVLLKERLFSEVDRMRVNPSDNEFAESLKDILDNFLHDDAEIRVMADIDYFRLERKLLRTLAALFILAWQTREARVIG